MLNNTHTHTHTAIQIFNLQLNIILSNFFQLSLYCFFTSVVINLSEVAVRLKLLEKKL